MSQRAFSHGVRLVLTSLLALASLPAIAQSSSPVTLSRVATHASDPSPAFSREALSGLGSPHAFQTADAVIPVADDSEGDGIHTLTYSSDGSKILVTHRITDNVAVFDAETLELLGSVTVGRYPIDLVATADVALVACAGSDQVWIIDLITFETTVVPTYGLPVRVAISPDGTTGYVGTALIDETYLEAFDLATGLIAWSSDDYNNGSLVTTIFGAYTNRDLLPLMQFSPLLVLPDGRLVAAGYDHVVMTWNHVEVYDPIDGDVTRFPAQGPVLAARVTSDGSSVVYVERVGDGSHVVRRDLPTLVETARVPAPALQSELLDFALSALGDKALLPVLEASGESTALVRLGTGTITLYPFEETVGYPWWFGTPSTGNTAVVGSWRTRLFDFDTETYSSDLPEAFAERGAVSPSAPRLAFSDPHFVERLHVASFEEGPLTVDTTVATGAGLEPDASYRLAMTPDGGQAVVTHFMPSPRIILDTAYATPSVVAIVDLADRAVSGLTEVSPGIEDVIVSPDGRWALAFGTSSEAVELIDLMAREVASSLPLGRGHGAAAFSPTGTEVYLTFNGDQDALRVADVSAAGTLELAASIPVSGIGQRLVTGFGSFGNLITYTSGGLALTPDGAYALVVAPDLGVLHIVDTAAQTLVQSLDLPAESLALTLAGDDHAVLAPWLGNQCTVVYLDGPASSIIATPPCPSSVIDVAYDPETHRALVASLASPDARWVHVESGTSETLPLPSADFRTLEAAVRSDGAPLLMGWTLEDERFRGALLDGSTLRSLTSPLTGETYLGRDMAYSPTLNQTVVTIPGPDVLLLFEAAPVANVPGPTPRSLDLRLASANPTRGPVTFAFEHRGGEAELTVFDVLGRRVQTLTGSPVPPGAHRATWDPGAAASGVYVARLRTAEGSTSVTFTLLD